MSPPVDQSRRLAGQTGVAHAFFGRRGGVSTGVFTSLNMSEAAGDDPHHVAKNRAQATDLLGFPASSLVTMQQVHSAGVVTLAKAPAARHAADATVTNMPGLVLGILTADCAPVLLADTGAGVVGALHAGWKGALAGICDTTVAAMAELGASPARIVAAIGPTISVANYEVGPDFAADLAATYGHGDRIVRPNGGREHFDLPGFVADRLRAAGVGDVEDLGICTYANPGRYFSHRFATHRGTTTGRQIAMIALT